MLSTRSECVVPQAESDVFVSGTVAAVIEAASHQGSNVKVNPANELGEGKEMATNRGLPGEGYFTAQAQPISVPEEVASVAEQAVEDSSSIHKVHSEACLNKEDKYYAEYDKAV